MSSPSSRRSWSSSARPRWRRGSSSCGTPRTRLIVLGATTGGLLAAGVLGIFSIGLPLIVAAVCCLFAWGRVASAARPVPSGAPLLSAVAGVVTGAVVVVAILAG